MYSFISYSSAMDIRQSIARSPPPHPRARPPGARAHAEDDILQTPHVDPPEPEHEKGAELGVPAHAEDQLPSSRHHLLHGYTRDPGAGRHPARGGGDLQKSPGDVLRGTEVQADASHFRLVKDLGRNDLHRRLPSHFLEGGHRLDARPGEGGPPGAEPGRFEESATRSLR